MELSKAKINLYEWWLSQKEKPYTKLSQIEMQELWNIYQEVMEYYEDY